MGGDNDGTKSKNARKRANKKAREAAETQEQEATEPDVAVAAAGAPPAEKLENGNSKDEVKEDTATDVPAKQEDPEPAAAKDAPVEDAPPPSKAELPEEPKGSASEDSTHCTESPAETSMESAAPQATEATAAVSEEPAGKPSSTAQEAEETLPETTPALTEDKAPEKAAEAGEAAPPAVEEKAAAPAVEEKATAPAVEEKAAAPAVEEKAAAPAVEEKAAAPAVEEKAAAPAVEEKAAAPAVEEKAAAPAVEEKAAAAAVEEKAQVVEEKSAPAEAPVTAKAEEPPTNGKSAAAEENGKHTEIKQQLQKAAISGNVDMIKSARNAAKQAGMSIKDISRIIAHAQDEANLAGTPPPAPKLETSAPVAQDAEERRAEQPVETPPKSDVKTSEDANKEPAETAPRSDVKTSEDAIKAKQRLMELEAKKKAALESVKANEEKREAELQAKRKAAEESIKAQMAMKEKREAELAAKRAAAEEAIKAKQMVEKEWLSEEMQAKHKAAEQVLKERRQAELEAKKKAALDAAKAKAAAEEKRGAELDAKRKAAEEALKAREMLNKEKRDAELQAKRKAAEESVKAQMAMKEKRQAELEAKKKAAEAALAAREGRTPAEAPAVTPRTLTERIAMLKKKDDPDLMEGLPSKADLTAAMDAIDEEPEQQQKEAPGRSQKKKVEEPEVVDSDDDMPPLDNEDKKTVKPVRAAPTPAKAAAPAAAAPAPAEPKPQAVGGDNAGEDPPTQDSQDDKPKLMKLLKPVRVAAPTPPVKELAAAAAARVTEEHHIGTARKETPEEHHIGDDDDDDMPPLDNEEAAPSARNDDAQSADDDDMPPLDQDGPPPASGAPVNDAPPKRKFMPPGRAKGAEEGGVADHRPRRGPFPDEFKAAQELLETARGAGKEEAEAGLALAQLHLDSAQFAEAERVARDAWMIYEEVDDAEGQKGEARAAKIVVKTYLDSEKAEDALKLAQEQTSRFKKSESHMAHAIMSLALVDCHMATDRPKEALKAAAAAQTSLKGMDEDATLVKVLCAQALANAKVATSKSLQNAEEALMTVQRMGNFKEQAATLLIASKVHQSRTEMQEAYNCGDSSLNIAREVGCRRAEAAALKDVAEVCLAAQSEQELAVKYINESISICEEMGDYLGEVAARQVAANWFLVAGKQDDAKDMVKKALEVARESTDRRQVRSTIELLTSIYAQEGKLAEVLEIVKEESKLAKESKDTRRELSAMQTIVGVQLALEQPVASLHTAETAMEQLAKCGDKKVEAWCLQLLAEVYFSSQRFEDAIGVGLKSQSLLRESGDVRAAVGVLDLLFAVYYQTGNEAGALKARVESRMTYQQAGWRDEEAGALMQIAELVAQLQGPKEAFKSIKEAVQIYKDIQDTRGEAQALIMLSRAQMMAKMATEALRTTVSARTLFKLLNDSSGQAQAMQTAAEVYLENGAYEEAVRVTKQARGLFQKGNDAKGEAEALQAIANVYMTVLANNTEGGRAPRREAIKDALSATTDWLNHLQTLGDAEKQVTATIQLSKLYRTNGEGQKALQAAQEAVEKATSMDEAQAVASAVLAVAEAQLFLGNQSEACSSADDAVQLWEQLGNSEMINAARKIAEDAKKANRPQVNGRPTPHVAGDDEDPTYRELKISNTGKSVSSGFSKVPQAALDRGNHGLPKPSRPGSMNEADSQSSKMEAQEQRPGIRGPRRGFSEMAMKKDDDQSNEAPAPPYSLAPARNNEAPSKQNEATRSEPNQERRRREMMASFTSKTGPPPQVALENNPLWAVLHVVRPDWNASELRVVAEKLSSIQIDTPQELFSQLRINGVSGINEKLKDAGKRQIKPETLQALLAYGNRELPQMLD